MSSADDLDEREPPSPSDNGKACVRVFYVPPPLRQMHANVYTNFGLVSAMTTSQCVHLCDREVKQGRDK